MGLTALEQRLLQAQKIQEQRPWKHSTGPKTEKGKNISKNNSFKHGACCNEVRDLGRQFTAWKKDLNQLIDLF